jgi:lipase
MIDSYRFDPARWLREAGTEASEQRITSAVDALAYQPASTVQAMARAVVEFTGSPTYEAMLRSVFDLHEVHLVCGERSRNSWDVPDWALEAAASYSEIPDAGHMMMLEAPEQLGRRLRQLLEKRSAV